MLSNLISEYRKIGFSMRDSQIIDISKMEVNWLPFLNYKKQKELFFFQLVSGKMLDQGPVLVITFQVFMIQVLKNSEGKVIEGDPVINFFY